MKTIKIMSILFLIGIIVIVSFFYIGLSKTTWGGWTPPSTELELDAGELAWKNKVELSYDCKIDFIGLDDAFMEDSIIYTNIDYKENSVLKKDMNDSIEGITNKIASSFVKSSKTKREQSYISIRYSYVHNYENDSVIYNIPESRTCLYNVSDQKNMPVISKLIIPKFGYFDYLPEKKDLFYFRLGEGMWSYFKSTSHHDSLVKYYHIKEDLKFGKLNECIRYKTKLPTHIELENGWMESHHSFVFYENRCVSALITYKCFPQKNNLSLKDFCRKIAEISPERLEKSRKEKWSLADTIRNSNYNFHGKMWGVWVSFKTDTLKEPFTIKYETSLADFNYYRTAEFDRN